MSLHCQGDKQVRFSLESLGFAKTGHHVEKRMSEALNVLKQLTLNSDVNVCPPGHRNFVAHLFLTLCAVPLQFAAQNVEALVETVCVSSIQPSASSTS